MADILDANVLFGFWPKRKVLADLKSVKELAAKHGGFTCERSVSYYQKLYTDYRITPNDENAVKQF